MTKEEALKILFKSHWTNEVEEALETLIPEYAEKIGNEIIKRRILELFINYGSKSEVDAIKMWLEDK